MKIYLSCDVVYSKNSENSPSLSAHEGKQMGYTSRTIQSKQWLCGPVWLHVSASGAVADVECVVQFDL